jgi:hypothetical protein
MATRSVDWTTFEGGSFDREAFSRVWLLALGAYGVGDLVTSIALIWFSPLYVEANPVISEAIALFGGGGFLAIKLLVFYACIGISVWGGVLDDDPLLFYGPPIALTLFGLVMTVHNMALML